MKIYQLTSDLKKVWHNLDLEGVKTIKDLIKVVARNREQFIYDDLLNCYEIYVEKIPKKIAKYNELTIVLDMENLEIRYFSDLCN